MNIKRIEQGTHRGDYIVEVDGVKKIMPYSDILELQKELKKKVEESKKKVEPITFQNNDVEPTVADVEEAPVKEEVMIDPVTDEVTEDSSINAVKEVIEVEPVEEFIVEEPKPKKKSRKNRK